MTERDFDLNSFFERFYYAGIGSRNITRATSYLFMRFACCMAFKGGKLRSGGASGADTSFEVGAQIAYDALSQKFGLPAGAYKHVHDIFLPFREFNGRKNDPERGYLFLKSSKAEDIAAQFHPGWERLTFGPRSMMSRNSMQALGADLETPARFTFCHTNDGAFTGAMTSHKSGGTGQAIRICSDNDIKVYNSGNKSHRISMQQWIDECEKSIQITFGISPTALVDEFLSNHVGIEKSMTGDLVKMADLGEVDALIHGTNCFHMNSGIAKSVRETFPEAYDSFQQGKKGDKKRLNTIEQVTVKRNGRNVTIVNAFVQHSYGRDEDVCYVDAEAVRKCFKAAAEMLPKGSRIGIPRIGAGLGNGCWVSLSNIIQLEMKDHDLVLVDLPSSELSSQMEYEPPQAKRPDADQMNLI